LYNACAGAWVETSETSTLIWQEAISELEDVATYGQPTFALKKSEGLRESCMDLILDWGACGESNSEKTGQDESTIED